MVATPKDEVSESQGPSAPLSQIDHGLHAIRIVNRLKAHGRATSVSSEGPSSTESSISAKEQVAPAAPPIPIHKPILTGVRRPPGLMPADLKANIYIFKPEECVRPSLGVKGKLASVLAHTDLKAASAMVESRLLKPIASALSKAPPVKIPTASNTTAASEALHLPSRFVTVGMAPGLLRPTGGALLSSRLPAPTFSAPKSELPSMTGGSSTMGRM
ncbi:hypothetical protein DFH29DRAFT_1006898 [Suillus ampliporus]|nr:hypothetical protein DFH29DRAFT_1006898 [Suillus ampliporus]